MFPKSSLSMDANPRNRAQTKDAAKSIHLETQPAVLSDAAGLSQEPERTSGWADLVYRIQRNESAALEELYQVFSKGIRYFLCRQLGPQELDDKVHDTFLIVVQAIQRGELREPERLMGFVRTIVRRQVAGYIDEIVQNRRESTTLDLDIVVPDARRNPEQNVAFRQKIEIMKSILRALGERDREILTRFYIYEQTQEQICEELDLTETQFRLLKSRAKARFGVLGRRKLQRSNLVHLFLRASARGAH